MTTMGSEFRLKTPEARVLCLLLALYGFKVHGYVTASLASFFLGRDAHDAASSAASADQDAQLTYELHGLSVQLDALRPRNEGR